ncbi:hypothetical protein Trydic_g10728 [Trypoxylus dichotomus]
MDKEKSSSLGDGHGLREMPNWEHGAGTKDSLRRYSPPQLSKTPRYPNALTRAEKDDAKIFVEVISLKRDEYHRVY